MKLNYFYHQTFIASKIVALGKDSSLHTYREYCKAVKTAIIK